MSKRFGFTLAEVLITLGIIGVVAAFTIPALIQNFNTRSWNTAASNFEAKLGETLRVMNTQHELASLQTTEEFVDKLQKHMKTLKICNNTDLASCFTGEINGSAKVVDITDENSYDNDYTKALQAKDIKTANELGQKDWGTNTVGVLFANGVSAIFAYNPNCSANPYDNNSIKITGGKNSVSFTTDCIAVLYDVSANAKPNEKGKDIRTSTIARIGQDNCTFKIGATCIIGFKPQTFITYDECTNLKSELGINRCGENTDYWAGAAKTCGGKSKVVNSEELRQIASFIYGTEVSLRETTEGFYNPALATKIGFPSSADSVFYVWGNDELDGYYTRNRTFRATSTYGEGPNTPDERSNSATLVLCKE